MSELNERAREALFDCFGPEVWVVGEIHGLKEHAKSGHVYFDLVEKPAAGSEQYIARISCAFFRGSLVQWQRSLRVLGLPGFDLASGMEVKLKARVDLFVKEGRYQLIVSEIDPSYTFGAIARRRAATIETLKDLGLMERNKALPIAAVALNIGLITSRGSAAYQDFTTIIAASPYAFRVRLHDAHMQGENTVPEVCAGIRVLQKLPEVDVIVIIRGGGARTDLFVFDDMALCRSVAECTKPVITGIGHEIDLSVADLVANTHFVTPTDAARFLVSRADAVWGFLDKAAADLDRHARILLDESSRRLRMAASGIALATQGGTVRARTRLEGARSSLMHGSYRLVAQNQRRMIMLGSDLKGHVSRRIGDVSSLLDRVVLGMRMGADTLLKYALRDIEGHHGRMLRDISSGLHTRLQALERHEKELELMRPAHILARGYSITLGPDGRALNHADQANIDDRIVSILRAGRIRSVVCEKEPSES